MDNDNKNLNQNSNQPKKQNNSPFRKFLYLTISIVLLICLFWVFSSQQSGKEITLSEFTQELNAGHIERVELNAEEVEILGSTSFSVGMEVFAERYDWENFITVENVTAETTVDENVTIAGYKKITVTQALQSVGVPFNPDQSKKDVVEKVVFYVYLPGGTMSKFLSTNMNLDLCTEHWSMADNAANGWTRVEFSKGGAYDDYKLFAFSYFLDGMPEGTEILISELIYITAE